MREPNFKSRSPWLLAALCFGCFVLTLDTAARSQEPGNKGAKGDKSASNGDKGGDQGFVPLFNGKDLSGWDTTGKWGYEPDGVVALKPPYGRRRLIPDYQSFLWSKRTYDNFVLDLEFKVEANASSGVFMRSTSSRSYIQTQIRDSHGKQGPLGDDTAGAIVDVVAPTKNMAKPAGEWNHMIITCDGNRMQVELNGEQVVSTDLSKSPQARDIRSGRLGFENANSPIAFRNVRIKELKRQ